MTDARAAVGLDRLPWLTDEPGPRARAKGSARELLGWAVAGLLLIAGASYWLGMRAVRPVESSLPAEATVKLPDIRNNVQPQLPIVEQPEVETVPSPAPAVAGPVAGTPARRTSSAHVTRRKTLSPMDTTHSDLTRTVAEQERASARPKSAGTAAKPAPPARATALASRSQLRLWPAQQSQGANGRIVRIGAFGSRDQAKLGWRRMQRVYPAVARLPATVVMDRNSAGRAFYRFQIGTTSQAHSEVLCQRMEKMLRFSCAVVGLPWKAKVER